MAVFAIILWQVAHKFVRRLSTEVVAVRDEVRQGRAAISLQREVIELILGEVKVSEIRM